ncbi:hypothetical protein LTS18_012439, partial [Coniosporium uncinatum]
GGEDAECGQNIWVRKVEKADPNSDAGGAQTNGDAEKDDGQRNGKLNGDKGKKEEAKVEYRYINMGGKNTASMQPGERIIVMTPGGGGWGKEGEESLVKGKPDPKHWWRQGSVATRQAEAEASA